MIEQALRALERRELEQAHIAAIPIAAVGEVMARTQGVEKAESDWFNPCGRLLYQQQAKEAVKPEAAIAFLRLCRHRRVPSWVLEQIDLKLIRAAANAYEL